MQIPFDRRLLINLNTFSFKTSKIHSYREKKYFREEFVVMYYHSHLYCDDYASFMSQMLKY